MTDNIRFEWMMCDLLSSYKYKGLDPQSPGLKDNGKDATYYDEEHAVVFAFSIRKDWKTKFAEDFESAKKNNLVFATFVFGSNQVLPATERDKIRAEKKAEGIEVDFYGAERIKVLLDTHYKKIRQIYLGIQDNTTIRKKIRNTLFDPFSEVTMPPRWKALGIITHLDMIGLFDLIKDEDLTIVCETQEELDSLKSFTDTFVRLRKLATQLDTYVHTAVLTNFPTNMASVQHQISEYVKLRLVGANMGEIERRITTGYAARSDNDLRECEQVYDAIKYSQEIKSLSETLFGILSAYLQTRENVLALSGFQLADRNNALFHFTGRAI